jgi:hypothetical protein
MPEVTQTTERNGRLCNQIIRNVATSFIAKKNDLFVIYSSHEKIAKLGIPLFVGKQTYNETIPVNDETFFEILESSPIHKNLNPNASYFQTKEISNFIYNYLNHDSDVRQNIMDHNFYKDRYENNNDCFVHIRLGDIASMSPGLNYYLNAIHKIADKVDKIIISTDSPNHEIINKLMNVFDGKVQLLTTDEVSTIQFGSTCKYIILSHGSFSAVIGWLGFFSEIYYPEYKSGRIWFGDMFSIETWNKFEYV